MADPSKTTTGISPTDPARHQPPAESRREGTPTELPGSAADHRLLETVLRSIDDGVVVCDRHGKFLVFNEAARRIIGLGAQDAPPSEWSSVYGCFRPDGVTPYPFSELPLVRALRGEKVSDAEMFIRNEGNPAGVWVSINSSPLYDEGGAIWGGVIVFRDVTDKKKASESVERLSRAVERTTDTVFVTDADGRIEYVNPAFEQTTGYTRDEVLGRRPSILKSGRHEDGFYSRLWATILAGDVYSGTVINRKKNGDLFHAEQTITPVRNSGGALSHFVSVLRDVTEIRRARERDAELRIARIVQQHLYPKDFPTIPGFDAAGGAFPAVDTGGDYYDFIRMPDGHLAIVIGDVSGHRFGAALVMAETRAYLRSLSRTTSDVATILRRVNAHLAQDTEDARFVTLAMVRIDPSRRTLAYASAGHPPGYLLDRDGRIKRRLCATGTPLGLFPDGEFPASEEVELEVDDVLLLLTDGVTEARDPSGDFFGAERAIRVVAARRDRRAPQIVESLYRATREFSSGSPQLDDITAVVCKVTEPTR